MFASALMASNTAKAEAAGRCPAAIMAEGSRRLPGWRVSQIEVEMSSAAALHVARGREAVAGRRRKGQALGWLGANRWRRHSCDSKSAWTSGGTEESAA